MIILSVCGVNYYNRHKHDKQIAFAKTEAERYISEKYGFEADSIEPDDVKYVSFVDGDNFLLAFKAAKDGKEFYIFTENSEDKTVCYDNYQWEEISAAAEKYISDNFPNGHITYLQFACEDFFFNTFMDRDRYFDGENAAAFLEKCRGHIIMMCYDTEFSQSEIESIIPIGGINIEFTSFDTKAHLDEYFNSLTERYSSLYYSKELEKYAPYITDYIKTDKNEVSGYDITILENDEFRYAYFPVEPRKLVTRADITAEPVEKSKVTEIFTKYGEENSLGKPLSKEYFFDSIYGDVWVYYPLEKLNGYDIENVGLAWFSAGGMSNNHNIEKAQICGDYAVFNMPFGEDYFMLVVTSELGEYVPNYG
ncbi:MAG: hypothetical protein ACI4JY_10880 [Oscillospiraceae bacterium]